MELLRPRAAKHGWCSSQPFVTPVVPTTIDDTIAPPGKHVVHMFGRHAPHGLRKGSWEQERDSFARAVLATIDRFAPGFRAGSSTCRCWRRPTPSAS